MCSRYQVHAASVPLRLLFPATLSQLSPISLLNLIQASLLNTTFLESLYSLITPDKIVSHYSLTLLYPSSKNLICQEKVIIYVFIHLLVPCLHL